jgi:hypothetical protein
MDDDQSVREALRQDQFFGARVLKSSTVGED